MSRLKHIHTALLILAATLLSVCVAGCSDDIDAPSGPQSDCINLTVSVPLALGTRAATDDLNEFKVRSLHLYFFAAEGYDEATSVYLFDYEVPDEFDVTHSLRISLPEDALKSGGLFGLTADECRVYAVANVDESLLRSESVAGLKATVVGSGFSNTAVQDAFAMDGEAVLNLDRATRTVTGSIELHRAAAKLTLAVDLPQSVTAKETVLNPNDGTTSEVEIVYTPRAEQMHVWLSNGVKESELNTAPLPVEGERLYSNEILVADKVGSSLIPDDSQQKYKYVQEIPFYSYPGKWDPYAASGNCRLTLMIPWSYKDASGQQQNTVTYYSLSVNPDGNEIVRNRHYDMRVSVNRLGGSSVQTPVDMQFDWNYEIEWNRQTLPTDIKEIRYLLLNNNDWNSTIRFSNTELGAYSYEMTNTDYIEIPYNSSHPVEIASVQLKWRDYLNNEDRTIALVVTGGNNTYKYSTTVAGYNESSQYAGIEIDQTNQLLKIKRSLLHIAWEKVSDNNYKPVIKTRETAISAYTFLIKLRHADDANTDANISITQVPAIYITSQYTLYSNYRFVNNNNGDYYVRVNVGSNWRPKYDYYYGYVTTNSSMPSNSTQKMYYLGSIHNDNNVQNKNTYILTITKFNAGDYIIGDPRKHSIDNLPIANNAADNSPGWYVKDVNNRQLQYYYPADGDSVKERFIAPRLRVASQWGVTYPVTRDGALRRCASYQENGRPAGRWRLPTIAEIEYIAKLSSKRLIPYLFGTQGNTAHYWCASGGVDVNNNVDNPSVTDNDNDDNKAVRCVYDEWYWGNDTLTAANKNKFTWGDRQRSVSGNN